MLTKSGAAWRRSSTESKQSSLFLALILAVVEVGFDFCCVVSIKGRQGGYLLAS